MVRCGKDALCLLVVVSLLGTGLPAYRGRRQVSYQEDDSRPTHQKDISRVVPVTRLPLPAPVPYPGNISTFFTAITSRRPMTKEIHSHQQRDGATSGELLPRLQGKSKDGIYYPDSPSKTKRHSRSSYRPPELPANGLELPLATSSHPTYSNPPRHEGPRAVPSELTFDGAGFLLPDSYSQPLRSAVTLNSGRPRKLGEQPPNTPYRKAPARGHRQNIAIPNWFDNSSSTPEHYMGRDNLILVTHSDSFVPNDPGQAPHHNPSGEVAATSVPYQERLPMAMIAGHPAVFSEQPAPLTSASYRPTMYLTKDPAVRPQVAYLEGSPSSISNFDAQSQSSVNIEAYRPQHPILLDLGPTQKFRLRRSLPRSNARDLRQPSTVRFPSPTPSGTEFVPISGPFGVDIPPFRLYRENVSPRSRGHFHSFPDQEFRPISFHPRQEVRSGPGPHFYASEARRQSFGILGSGNFEVLRGGILPDDGPSAHRGNSFDYGEITLDGPLLGFQGFDNFHSQLFNALSKQSPVAAAPPSGGHQAASQLIPRSVRLLAMA